MLAIGYGETRSADTNDTVLGKSKNRRTVFLVFKKTN
jgi:outer membrane protein OmpA-like peptidoglycan-associated protein